MKPPRAWAIAIVGVFLGLSFALAASPESLPATAAATSPASAPTTSPTTAPAAVTWKLEEEKLGDFGDDVDEQAASEEGNHVVYILRDGEHRKLMLDGKELAKFDTVLKQSLAISPDGKRVACVVSNSEKWSMWCDGKLGKAYQTILPRKRHIGPLVPYFSPDGKRLAYFAANEADRIFAIVDGKEDPVLEKVDADSFTWSESSKSYGYRASAGEGEKEEHFIVINGKTGPNHKEIDDRPLAFCFLTFSADGAHWAYRIRNENQHRYVIDGKETQAYPDLGSHFLFSQDGKHYAFVVGKEDEQKKQIVRDGREGAPFQCRVIRDLTFSSDGEHLAYVIDKNDKATLMLDEKQISEYPGIVGLTFSADDKHFAYLAWKEKGKCFVVKDGKECLSGGPPSDREPHLSKDGNRLAWVTFMGNGKRVLSDNYDGPEFEKLVAIYFTPGCRHLVYMVEIDSKPTMVIDGAIQMKCDRCFGNFHIDDKNVIEYLAVKNKTLYRVRHVPQPAAN